MCLYPKRIINRKYTVTEKNQGEVPLPPVIGTDEYGKDIYDERILYVNVPCGQCEECRKQKARNWQVRLTEELKEWKYPYFITLTFAPKELEELLKKTNLKECNAVAGYAVRHMLERYRKDHKKSLRHWLITELGHEGTERIHLHGLIFSNEPLEFIPDETEHFYKWKYWKYGLMFVGDYCTLKTINYIVKYINKIDTDHKGFVGQILASPGIGKNWLERYKTIQYHYKPKESKDYYLLPNGSKVKLPTYYKNKLYNEEERELIWRDFMDMKVESVNGINYQQKYTPPTVMGNIIDKAQEQNKLFGYGDDSKGWRKKPYNVTRRMLQEVHRKECIAEMKRKNAEKSEKMEQIILKNLYN